jgi:predicted DNA-binding transcriptional regulator AlpA
MAGELTAPAGLAEFLTTNQVGALLQLAPSTLKKMRVSGDGPPFRKFGNAVRYERSDIDVWASERRCRSTTDADRLAAASASIRRADGRKAGL